jgi:shikimate 5-dehydrogenase
MARYTVIVNTTPLGMHPKVNECPPLDYTQLTSQHLLYDVVYNPEKTLFLQRGEEAGATTCNGISMLIGQAQAVHVIGSQQNGLGTVAAVFHIIISCAFFQHRMFLLSDDVASA